MVFTGVMDHGSASRGGHWLWGGSRSRSGRREPTASGSPWTTIGPLATNGSRASHGCATCPPGTFIGSGGQPKRSRPRRLKHSPLPHDVPHPGCPVPPRLARPGVPGYTFGYTPADHRRDRSPLWNVSAVPNHLAVMRWLHIYRSITGLPVWDGAQRTTGSNGFRRGTRTCSVLVAAGGSALTGSDPGRGLAADRAPAGRGEM